MDQRTLPSVGVAATSRPRLAMRRRARRNAAILLFMLDQALIFIAFAIAYWTRYRTDVPPPFEVILSEVDTENFVEFSAFLPITLLLMAVLALLFTTRRLYRNLPRRSIIDQVARISGATLTGIALLIVIVFLYQPFFYSRLIFALAGLNIIVLLTLARLIIAGVIHWRWARGIGRERVVVVGGTGLGQEVMGAISALPGLGYTLVGYLDERAIIAETTSNKEQRVYRHLGAPADFPRIVQEQAVDQAILALPFWNQGLLPELVAICREKGIEYQIAPDLYQISFDRVDVMHVSGVPLIRPKELSLRGLNLVIKRLFDSAMVLLSLPFTVPLALIVALCIKLDSPGGKVLFTQTRVGRNGQPFTCYKFRTMVPDAEAKKADLSTHNEADGPLFKMRNDPRVTRVGRWLRRSSLDELPQLFNVMRGEMSLIGPRPALPEEVATYEPWHRRRLEVSPGLAGLGQALGRSELAFDEMVRLDIYYVENWTIGMDIRIMLMIIPAVLSGRGAY